MGLLQPRCGSHEEAGRLHRLSLRLEPSLPAGRCQGAFPPFFATKKRPVGDFFSTFWPGGCLIGMGGTCGGGGVKSASRADSLPPCIRWVTLPRSHGCNSNGPCHMKGCFKHAPAHAPQGGAYVGTRPKGAQDAEPFRWRLKVSPVRKSIIFRNFFEKSFRTPLRVRIRVGGRQDASALGRFHLPRPLRPRGRASRSSPLDPSLRHYLFLGEACAASPDPTCGNVPLHPL